MDKLIYTTQTTISNLYENRSIRSQNLANMNVPGYRRDLQVETSGTVYAHIMDTLDTRAFSLRTDVTSFSAEPAELKHTEESLDVAIRGEGYFLVEGSNGPYLSRRGDMSVDQNGFLKNGDQAIMLDVNQNQIEVPPYRRITISSQGEITIEPLNAPAGTFQLVGQLGMTSAADVTLKKYEDGKIRAEDGTLPPADDQVTVMQHYLEQSNVNIVDELVSSIEEQRQYEIGVKMIKTAKSLDESGASLLKMPS